MASLKELAIQAWQTREQERLQFAQERIPEVKDEFKETFGVSVDDVGGELLIMDGKVFVKFADLMVRPCYSEGHLDGFAVFLTHPDGGMVRTVQNAYNLADLGKILTNPKFIAKNSWHYEAYWAPQTNDNDTRPFCPLLGWQQCRDDCAWWSAAGCGLIISNLE